MRLWIIESATYTDILFVLSQLSVGIRFNWLKWKGDDENSFNRLHFKMLKYKIVTNPQPVYYFEKADSTSTSAVDIDYSLQSTAYVTVMDIMLCCLNNISVSDFLFFFWLAPTCHFLHSFLCGQVGESGGFLKNNIQIAISYYFYTKHLKM